MAEGRTSKWRRLDSLSGAALIAWALMAIFGWELWCPGRSLFRWDALLYNWPMLLETREQWLSGHWPFWAASFCAGTPLLENINAGVLYPVRLITWLLPLRAGYDVFLLFHLWLSFFAAHLLLRRGFRFTCTASWFGALVYGACGYARSTWDTHNFMAIPWIPLGLLGLLLAARGVAPVRAMLLTAGCWVMMLLGGDFQNACLWFGVAALLALVHRQRIRLALVLGCAAVLAVAITAAQWLPAFEAAAWSYRSGGLEGQEALERSFHPVRLLELFIPYVFGNRDAWFAIPLAGEGATKLSPWTSSCHVGLVTLLAAVLAIRKRRSWKIRFALLLTVGATLLAFGRFLPGFDLWQSLPVIRNFRYPEKYLLWASLGWSLLAACGCGRLLALFRYPRLHSLRRRWIGGWGLTVALGGVAASLLVQQMNDFQPYITPWIAVSMMMALVIVLTLLVQSHAASTGRFGLGLVLLLSLLLPWFRELPTTTSFHPLEMPAFARAIRESSDPFGRLLRDRAVQQVPLPASFASLRPSERQSVFYRESLAFNVPRIWGLYSAEGFSPAEPGGMRALRLEQAAPEDEKQVPEITALADFCEKTSVRWLITTPARLFMLRQAGLEVERYEGWGQPDQVVLARIQTPEAGIIIDGEQQGRRLESIWRPRPGFIRIDVPPGTAGMLRMAETWMPGWRAINQRGESLEVSAADRAFVGVRVTEGTTQVRLRYEPPRWRAALAVSGVGLALFFGLWAGCTAQVLRRPALAAASACFLFMLCGLAARAHWACAFDEAFHLARGLELSADGDSRYSYYHPPLQNQLGGYFAQLAFGTRLSLPATKAAVDEDVLSYAVDVAAANARMYPGLVQAARWSSLAFSLLLLVVGVLWAAREAGPVAAWLACFGLALNPTLLAHGNLNTTDMGVTACALAGIFATRQGFCSRDARWLAWAGLAYLFASLAKFTGLIWFVAYLALVLPAAAILQQRVRPLLLIPVLLAAWLLGIALLYGPEPQLIRLQAPAILARMEIPGGRYFEGLFLQGGHALAGHKAYFDGRMFTEGSWWHMPAAIVLKLPAVWIAGAALAGLWGIRKLRRADVLVPLLPLLAFSLLLLFANRLAIGVRHALPLLAVAVVGTAVAAPRVRQQLLRRAALIALILSSVAAAVLSYPHYLSYFPAWAGGTEEGHRWLVDSNYDWGQELEDLEGQWAGVVDANAGRPPNLVYYGFLDPSVIYRMPVGPQSYLGYMGYERARRTGVAGLNEWLGGFEHMNGTTVASLSALNLEPHGINFALLSAQPSVGRIALCYRVTAEP